MDKIRKQAWEETLALWKRLSEIPDRELKWREKGNDFKNDVLAELGIERKQFGCPFCEVYYETDECPLGKCGHKGYDCYGTPYEYWEDHAHNQKAAKKFYKYLLILYKEEMSK